MRMTPTPNPLASTWNASTPRTVDRARAVPGTSRVHRRTARLMLLPWPSDIARSIAGRTLSGAGSRVHLMSEAVTWSITQLVEWVNAVVNETLGGEIWVE